MEFYQNGPLWSSIKTGHCGVLSKPAIVEFYQNRPLWSSVKLAIVEFYQNWPLSSSARWRPTRAAPATRDWLRSAPPVARPITPPSRPLQYPPRRAARPSRLGGPGTSSRHIDCSAPRIPRQAPLRSTYRRPYHASAEPSPRPLGPESWGLAANTGPQGQRNWQHQSPGYDRVRSKPPPTHTQ